MLYLHKLWSPKYVCKRLVLLDNFRSMRTKQLLADGELIILIPGELAHPDGCELDIVREGDTIRLWPVTHSDIVDGLRGPSKPSEVEVREPD